jgi:hypothetical protein
MTMENHNHSRATENVRHKKTTKEERRVIRERRHREHEEQIQSIYDSSWRQTPARQFSQYLKNNHVLGLLQPALTLLYGMPVKPKDLYEFFAEYLDDGAQTLFKISLLQAELKFKQHQVR